MMSGQRSFTKPVLLIVLLIIVSMICGCFQKSYTSKEEKDQLAHAIALARIYQKNNAPSIILNEVAFRVQDTLGPEAKLCLTDWVKGEYKDGGRYYMLINTATNEIYSDKDWLDARFYGRQLAEKLYGLSEGDMVVDVFGSRDLPERRDDPSFGERAVVNMLPIGSGENKQVIEDVFFGDDYKISFRITVNENVDMEPFKTLDSKALGKNVRVHVYKYPDEIFNVLKNDPDKRTMDNKDDLIEEYDSGNIESQYDPDGVYPAPDESYCGTWTGYPEDVSGQYDMTLGEPDVSGSWPVEMIFTWMSSGNSGDGMYVDDVKVTGTAEVSDDVMIMNGIYDEGSDRPESERGIRARIEQYGDGIRIVVLECDCDRVRTGDRFILRTKEN